MTLGNVLASLGLSVHIYRVGAVPASQGFVGVKSVNSREVFRTVPGT